MHHGNGNAQNRMRSSSFSNIQIKNNFRTPLSAEKLFEKYTSLAKEAMSSGDKTLSENYLQHADHFMRIIEDKNKNQNKPANDLAKPNESEKIYLIIAELIKKTIQKIKFNLVFCAN